MDPLDFFPYEPRGDQIKAIKKIHRYAANGEKILFQAPTGYGKTPVILAALLPLSLELGIPIIWAVRTGGETDRVIEELKEIPKRLDLDVFGMSFRGKRDMCLLARDMRIGDHESVSELCKRVKKKCRYYQNLPQGAAYFEQPTFFSEIFSYASREKICPYYLQFKLLKYATVVSLSYNYIFSDYMYWPIKRYLTHSGAFLVIDEAHNLDKAVSNLYSTNITLRTVERAINEIKIYLEDDVGGIGGLVDNIFRFLKREEAKITGEDDVFDPMELIETCDVDEEKVTVMSKYANSIISKKLAEGKAPRSSLRRLANFLESLLENLDMDGVAFIKYRDNKRTVFEIWDMRISGHLVDKWEEFESIIFTSGTLKPYEAFAEVSGVGNYKIVEGYFYVPPENVLPLIIKGVTTKGEELSNETIRKYEILIDASLNEIRKNIAIFFASYRIQQYFIDFLKEEAAKLGRKIFIENQNMPGEIVKKVHNEFKTQKTAILAGVMGGKFAEGLDYPGSTLEAIILIGIPFDRLTKRTTLYIEYFSKLYGQKKGKYYSYVVPALRRAAQAIGRAIRSPEDKAIIIAADQRYAYPTYFNLLPYFFTENARVVKSLNILIKLLKKFNLQIG
ncbi:MAG: ATP-dependent DNA helicase [Candidatus Njordarchaeia archaeon]